ncbi:hypothetical protein AMTR_s00091p00022650 [Amborella trichopoda]|uniref:Uncharacterized protein n=1 Tax=Amborella trichopoda TaxID=13333 RepID=W1NT92_AMBTC|nr:hypothetical protein AMTR_s00091p00022650 [Amborella trichopoda]
MQLPEFLGKTAANLTAFGVLKAHQLKGNMGELAQMAEEILKLEKLVSLILNPPISPLLYFVPSIFGYVEDRLEEFKGDLAYRGRFHLTLKAHLLKEGEYAALGESRSGIRRLASPFFGAILLKLRFYCHGSAWRWETSHCPIWNQVAFPC